MDLVVALATLVALAAIYAVVIWIDKRMPPGRPPSAPAALCIWNATVRRACARQRFALRWAKAKMKTARRRHICVARS